MGSMKWAAGLVVVCGVSQVAYGNDSAKAAANVEQTIAHRGASAVCPENTLAAYKSAIAASATAVEADVRRTKDGVLVSLHDATLDRTTDGEGPLAEVTLAELKRLDAGSWFDAKFRGERVPTLGEIFELCGKKIDVLLDLKEQGGDFDEAVATLVRKEGDPRRIVVGVRSVEQAERFRRLLPEARQLALIPNPDAIEDFAATGVEYIRLWPRWVEDDESLPGRVRRAKRKLHINGREGTPEEIIPKLKYRPESLSSDDPARLVKTLKRLQEERR